jgi:hypothetical protein
MDCYLRMPEGRRNAGPTFCRMTKAALKDQVGRNLLSYVDDIVVASNQKASHTRGKVLGCLVSTKGLEASPNKIKAILQMQPRKPKKNCKS